MGKPTGGSVDGRGARNKGSGATSGLGSVKKGVSLPVTLLGTVALGAAVVADEGRELTFKGEAVNDVLPSLREPAEKDGATRVQSAINEDQIAATSEIIRGKSRETWGGLIALGSAAGAVGAHSEKRKRRTGKKIDAPEPDNDSKGRG